MLHTPMIPMCHSIPQYQGDPSCGSRGAKPHFSIEGIAASISDPRSEQTAKLRWTFCAGLSAIETSSKILHMKHRPAGTTLQACWRWPARDSNSFLVMHFLPTHLFTKLFIGWEPSCIDTMSTSIPKKDKHVGPSHFAGATGNPSWQTFA